MLASTDDRSLSGGGIPNVKASIPDLVTEVKDIKTDLKDIKTEAKKGVYAFQAIREEMALQTSQRKLVMGSFSAPGSGTVLLNFSLFVAYGSLCILCR